MKFFPLCLLGTLLFLLSACAKPAPKECRSFILGTYEARFALQLILEAGTNQDEVLVIYQMYREIDGERYKGTAKATMSQDCSGVRLQPQVVEGIQVSGGFDILDPNDLYMEGNLSLNYRSVKVRLHKQ